MPRLSEFVSQITVTLISVTSRIESPHFPITSEIVNAFLSIKSKFSILNQREPTFNQTFLRFHESSIDE